MCTKRGRIQDSGEGAHGLQDTYCPGEGSEGGGCLLSFVKFLNIRPLLDARSVMQTLALSVFVYKRKKTFSAEITMPPHPLNAAVLSGEHSVLMAWPFDTRSMYI